MNEDVLYLKTLKTSDEGSEVWLLRNGDMITRGRLVIGYDGWDEVCWSVVDSDGQEFFVCFDDTLIGVTND